MRTSKRTPDGVEIIAREPALGAHPHPAQGGRLVPFNGVTKVLLADGTEKAECDVCGKLFETTKQVASHNASAHTVTDKRSTPVETIKTVLRVVQEQRNLATAEGRRSYQQEAADELNRRGVKTYRGGLWTAGAVNNIWNSYRTVYKVRARSMTPRITVAADAASTVLDRPLSVIENEPDVDEDGFVTLDDHKLFSEIHKDLRLLRDVADRIETNVLAAEDRMRQRPKVEFNDEELSALESLRRVWRNS